MTEHELCNMCTEYAKGTKCDNRETCKLLGIIKENKALKKEISELKHKMSYMINPNAIGNRNDMGW